MDMCEQNRAVVKPGTMETEMEKEMETEMEMEMETEMEMEMEINDRCCNWGDGQVKHPLVVQRLGMNR